jgi:putative SOS response-associated peptidase YedK
MCGRFTQCYSWEEVHRFLNVLLPSTAPNLRPRYNIAPTTMIDVIVDRGKGREMIQMRWGLIPEWWKKTAREVGGTFNARGEEAASKPMFRGAFKQRRCIIPASGFYEWTGPKTARQPHYFTRANGQVLGFARLWERWTDPKTGEDILSCSIITVEPSRWMSAYHNRMPAVLDERDFDAWLKGTAGPEVLKPAPEDLLREHPVSMRVNSSRASDDDATLIDPTPISDEAALPDIPNVPGEPYDGSPI